MYAIVHRQRNGHPNLQSDFFQGGAHPVDGVAVLLPSVGQRIGDDGKQVFRVVSILVLGDYLLHARLPPDAQPLPGLPPTVGQYAVLQVGFPQIGHIDERHATGVEREKLVCLHTLTAVNPRKE